MMGIPTQPIVRDPDVSHATFTRPDLTTFTRLDDLGWEAVGQKVLPYHQLLGHSERHPLSLRRATHSTGGIGPARPGWPAPHGRVPPMTLTSLWKIPCRQPPQPTVAEQLGLRDVFRTVVKGDFQAA